MSLTERGETIARDAFTAVGLQPLVNMLDGKRALSVELHKRMISITQTQTVDGSMPFILAAVDGSGDPATYIRLDGWAANSGTLAMLIDHLATNGIEN